MAEKVLAKGTIPFQAEGRMLQELGERLVASPEVALVELIKNAYDADSPSCEVRLAEKGKALLVIDHGHGMTFEEFAERWMRIATQGKAEERVSRIYKRPLTGAKGIGRFAVRYLGNDLTVVSVANDRSRRIKTRLTARFDWPRIDQLDDISKAKINYSLETAEREVPLGTILTIRGLKSSADFATNPQLRSAVLRIVTPFAGLDSGKFKAQRSQQKKDPGFRVSLPGADKEDKEGIDLADLVLKNYWARLQITLNGNSLSFRAWFSSSREPKKFNVKVASAISSGFVADIRYFPRRKGIFSRKGVDGRVAWKWVRENGGVAVVDHGFRVVPYGYEFDDWLHLDTDKAHSLRDWRSNIAQEHFPISPALRNRPADNPALYLPYTYQLVGAVFVESRPVTSSDAADLIPSMDREGFLKNAAFDELVEYVRAGIEFLALQDKRELDRISIREARAAAAEAREDVRRAIEHVTRSPTLTPSDRARITKAYSKLADQIEEIEEYNVQARRNLITMSLLGVVAGFMTHETKSLVFDMEAAIRTIISLGKRHASLRSIGAELTKRLAAFKGQLEYAQMFLAGTRTDNTMRMSAAGQIRHVLNRFETFAADHDISVEWEAKSEVKTPALAPAVYSGLILNLYTNALKALLSVTSSIRDPKILIRAWNEDGKHYLEVSDNGIGVPPELRKRIWDPLFTTTSDTGNPLGSGMGLGLTLVKQVVEANGGRIGIANDPPSGFNTTFRTFFPLE